MRKGLKKQPIPINSERIKKTIEHITVIVDEKTRKSKRKNVLKLIDTKRKILK